MIKNVKQYVSYYTTLDIPVEYKGLKLYPITVRDYYDFAIYSSVLTIDKDSVEDLEVISMNYLDFLIFYCMRDNTVDEQMQATKGQITYEKFIGILKLCLHCEDIQYNLSEGNHAKLVIDNVLITAQDFDELRKLIMYQNLIDYDDAFVNPEIREAYNEYWSVKNKDIIMPDLEQRIADTTAMTGISKKDILNMTYREFEMVFDAAKERLEYQINKTAEMSGFVKFKNPIDHWIYKRKRSKYEGVFTKYDDFKNKMK